MTAGSPRMGMALRLLGPMIECVCLIVLMNPGTRGRTIFGLAIEPFLYAGLACGLLMVIVGLLLSRTPTRRSREES